MFLIRSAFWLSVVVMLLPAAPDTGNTPPRVTAFEALSAAGTTVSDLSRFCDRNPDACVTGGSAFHVFADKVRYGVHLLYGVFGNHASDGPSVQPSSSTLKPGDVVPPWHDPHKANGAA